MARLRHLALLPVLLLAGCETAPPRVAPPAPLPHVAPPAPALATDWRDLPLTAGDWRYAQDAAGSSASFGNAVTIRCIRATRMITLSRTGATGAALTVQTSYGRKDLPAAGGVATLNASDPLLDQIAFSRGRFTVEAAGTSIVVMPTWAEPARVVEDCRL